ncbi:MAG: sulfatase-like hydrolase/transferase, partial [Planctomycetota bacterium]
MKLTRSTLLLLLGAAVVGATPAPAAERPPNIIHILGDDIGYDDIGPFGARDIPTLNLDRLAEQGMRLTHFYAPASTCTPTRVALLTGSYAPRAGVPGVLFPFATTGIAASEITIAELLRERGYATAVIGKWHLGHLPPFLP